MICYRSLKDVKPPLRTKSSRREKQTPQPNEDNKDGKDDADGKDDKSGDDTDGKDDKSGDDTDGKGKDESGKDKDGNDNKGDNEEGGDNYGSGGNVEPPSKRIHLEQETDLDRLFTKDQEVSSCFNPQKRSQVVVGINAVSRQLERDNLRAGLVCLSARPALMHRHLLMLATTRGVPYAALSSLSEHAAPLLGVKSALAIGFKVNTMVKA